MDKCNITKIKRFCAFSVLFLMVSTQSMAGVIISAIDARVNSGGPGYGGIVHSHNQDGLYNKYISGLTDFDEYMATNPFHTSNYFGYEWFSEIGTGASPVSASVTFDLGRPTKIDAVALWNEESSGIGVLNLFGSLDGVNFFDIAHKLMPQDNPFDETRPNDDYRYSAEVFEIAKFDLQYIRFDMSACPNQPSSFYSCSIGEVAFRQTDIPEPYTLSLFLIGITLFRVKHALIS